MRGNPTDFQIQLINRLAKRNFLKDEIFVFGGKSAGDRIIENRYIQLSKELLETFARNAKEGVSWLLNHSWSSSSEPVTIYGRTFDARLQPSNDKGETVELIIDKYIPRSDTIKNGRSANSIIEDIENGVLFDTSIGWSSDKYVCSVCNSNYWECNHWRGNTYEDGDGNMKLCYVIAKNPGYLMEESGVFDGAYKGAGISMCNAGDVFESPQGKFLVIDELKEVPKDTNVYGIYTSKGQLTTFIKKSDNQKVFAIKREEVLNNGGIEMSIINKLSEETGKSLTAEDVLKFAREGIQYHRITVANAITMGVRAMGNDFPAETWRDALENMDTDAILRITKTWEAQAKAELKAGQRFSNSQDTAAQIPDELYKVRGE